MADTRRLGHRFKPGLGPTGRRKFHPFRPWVTRQAVEIDTAAAEAFNRQYGG